MRENNHQRVVLCDTLERLVSASELDKYLGVYRIGSSLSAPEESLDFDLLFIQRDDRPPLYEDYLKRLYKGMLSGISSVSGFDASDAHTRNLIYTIIREADLAEAGEVTAAFQVGPISMNSNSFQLHICGPLTVTEIKCFSKLFPFHSLSFLAQNRPLHGPELSSVLSVDFPSQTCFNGWVSQLYKRGIAASTLIDREKCIRKILLCNCLFRRTPNPYNVVDSIISEWKEVGESPNMLDRVIAFTGVDPQL